MASMLQKSDESKKKLELRIQKLHALNPSVEELDWFIKYLEKQRNLKKFKVGDIVKINVSSMEELKSKFDEFNSKNVGGFITYVSCDEMSEMLENSSIIVRVKGSMNEEGLFGLRPPESFKGTRAWQGGCWYFPSTCVEKI
mgnify:FL=1|jgi:hypothetical protein